jgi:hypothetical protein
MTANMTTNMSDWSSKISETLANALSEDGKKMNGTIAEVGRKKKI